MFIVKGDGEVVFDIDTDNHIKSIMRQLSPDGVQELSMLLEDILVEIEDGDLDPEDAEIEVYMILDDVHQNKEEW